MQLANITLRSKVHFDNWKQIFDLQKQTVGFSAANKEEIVLSRPEKQLVTKLISKTIVDKWM